MGKNLSPKCKQCRREGTKLFLKGARCGTAKCAIVKRNYMPGMHGPKMARTRMTDFGRQLREKQKAKKIYNLLEKQFRNYLEAAVKNRQGDTGQNFYQLLEMRFDNIVAKAGWAESVRQARQLVNHAHFLVNGKKVNIPSYHLKINDVIAIRESSSKNKAFEGLTERMKNRQTPEWLFYDSKENKIKVVAIPELKQHSIDFDMKAIIEFYSR